MAKDKSKSARPPSGKRGKRAADDIPGLGGPLLLGFLSVVLGCTLGFLHFARTDPIQFNEKTARQQAEREARQGESAPKPRAPDIPVYYLGNDSGGAAWQSKREALAQARPGTLRISEGELNVWAKNAFNVASLRGDGGGLISITPATPNFYIGDDQLHVSMPVAIDAFGLKGSYRLVARGGFDASGGIMVFKADQLFLSAAQVPPIGPLPGLILKAAGAAFTVSDEYAELAPAWQAVSDVRIEDKALLLSIN